MVNQVRQTIVAQSVPGMEITDIYRGVFPFLAVLLLVLVVVIFAPSVALTGMELFMFD